MYRYRQNCTPYYSAACNIYDKLFLIHNMKITDSRRPKSRAMEKTTSPVLEA